MGKPRRIVEFNLIGSLLLLIWILILCISCSSEEINNTKSLENSFSEEQQLTKTVTATMISIKMETVETPDPSDIEVTRSPAVIRRAQVTVEILQKKANDSEKTCQYGCKAHLEGCDIKGNISYSTKEKIYHMPGQEYYLQTVITPMSGERWFCTEEEAIANGWRKAYR